MKIPSKVDLVAWGLIAAGVLALGLVVKGWRDDSLELPRVRDQAKQLKDNYAALEKRQAENATKTEKHGHEFDQAQDALNAGRGHAPDVRVCLDHSVPASRVASRGSAKPGDEASADPGVVPQAAQRDPEERAGPNIGPELYALIDKADDVALVAQSCQGWIRDNP